MSAPSRSNLHVGFDGRAFTSPAAGIRRYADGLASALVAQGDLRVTILGGSEAHVPPGAAYVPEGWHPPGNPGWVWWGLPRAAAAAGVDVLHAPAYTAPALASMPVVLTVHDVSYARHPEWYPHRRDAVRRAYYRISASRASAVITPSQFSASEIQAAYGLAAGRVAVVPMGVEPGFGTRQAGDLPAGLDTPFVLHVGDVHARRDPAVVVAALDRLSASGGPDLRLVLAGVDCGEIPALAEARARGRVVALGPVDEPTLHALYRRAVALVYPSRYEGFGFPVIEAMASGLPVIASRAASLPEVAGEAGMLVDPADGDAWAGALTRLVVEAGLREDLVARGRARAAGFTWARTARLTTEVYRQVTRA